jgi:acetylornithine deacetylase/succinyl-diaminopimelate desuccinylase-like protein
LSTTNALIYPHPAELLQNLIRFDTTNPPGNELACIEYINELLTGAGFETSLVARTPGRPNLVTRLKGAGNAPPLLLYGHVDVVTTQGQQWSYPPFEGRLVDGVIWGRGALDMKQGITMYLAALLQAKADGSSLVTLFSLPLSMKKISARMARNSSSNSMPDCLLGSAMH